MTVRLAEARYDDSPLSHNELLELKLSKIDFDDNKRSWETRRRGYGAIRKEILETIKSEARYVTYDSDHPYVWLSKLKATYAPSDL